MARRHKEIVAAPVEFGELASSDLQGQDFLSLRYVLIDDLLLLAGNPKLHNDPAIEASIVENGFRDPAAWDSTLNGGQGGLVEGNGRTTILKGMQDGGRALPRGIAKYIPTGQWAMPIIFGCDARSEEAALRYAIDHNNLTLGNGFTATEATKLWDEAGYLELLNRLEATENLPITVSQHDLEAILEASSHTNAGGVGSEAEDGGVERVEAEENHFGSEFSKPLDYMKFGTRKVPMTEDELFRLGDAFDLYVENKGTHYGFVGALLNGEL